MKQSQRRLLSLLLVLAICLTMTLAVIPGVAAADYWWLPYVEQPDSSFQAPGVKDGQVTSEGPYILLTSDVHRYAYLLKDLLEEANKVVKEDGSKTNVGFLAMGGDYANEQQIYADNMTIMKHAVEDNSPGTVVAYSKGNHEGSVSNEQFLEYTGMARVGETAVNKDGLYYYYNWGAETSKQTFLTSDIEALDKWLSEHNDGKPVFIVSHFPIHYYNERRTTVNADKLMDVLNKYPQVVFCWGHNHTESDPAYGTIRLPGDVIQCGADPETTTKELNFTYVNLGALRDGVNECNGLVAKVNPDHSVTYWYLGLGLQVQGDETWTDAQGNDNPIRVPTDPRVVSVTDVAPLNQESLKTIDRASIRVDRPLVDNKPALAGQDFSERYDAGEITWTAGGAPVEGTFDFDTPYTATLDLSAKEGYAFDENAKGLVNFAYIGPMGEYYPESDTKVIANDGKTLTLELTFENTVKQLAVPLEAAAAIEEGHQYVLASVDENAKYAAYYRYNPADHGEESRPNYRVTPHDVVIRDGKLASEVIPFVTFTAAKDDNGYLLYSDASLQENIGATTLNFLNLAIRGGGEMELEAAETAGMSIYNNWNIDSEGNPYVDVDGAICYPTFAKGAFSCTKDKSACNVKLFDCGLPTEALNYVVAASVPVPKTGEAPADTAAWTPADETFAAGTAYTATVTVPLSGPLPKGAVGRINGSPAKLTASEDGKSATLSYTFAPTAAEPKPFQGPAKKAETIESGKSYVIVAEGKAMTGALVDGLYLGAGDVTVDGDAITAGLTGDMIFTLEGDNENGYTIKGDSGYLAGKPIDDSPDTWGFVQQAQPGMTVTYADGVLTVKSTGAKAGPGGPGGPPPGGASNTFYLHDGHFHYSVLQTTPVELYEVATTRFTDIEGHWAEDYILDAVDAGLFKGTTDTTFEPESPMNRAMVVTTLYRMAGEPAVETESDFTDVPKDEYYTAAVNWAVAQKITNGTGDNKFEPEKNVSRQDFTTFLVRYANSQGLTLEGDIAIEFKDADKIADYAKDAVDLCVKTGIINGKGDGIFDPKGDLTRAECAKMLVVFQAAAK